MSSPDGNVLPQGTYAFEFKGQRLHGYTTDLSDDIQWRIAVHEFDRTPGAQTENMGRAPWRLRVTLAFVGADAFLDAQAFLFSLESTPSGLLVHPIYGKRQATCSGTTGARLATPEVNTYTLPVEFIENSLNASIIGEEGQGTPAKAASVQAQAAAVLAYVSQASAAYSAVQTLTGKATSMADAALASAQSGTVDATMVATLTGLPGEAAAAIVALRASESAETAAAAQAAIEVLLVQCNDLAEVAQSQAGPVTDYTVAEAIPLALLAARLYPGNAWARMNDLMQRNPQIVGLALIPAGTRLKIATV